MKADHISPGHPGSGEISAAEKAAAEWVLRRQTPLDPADENIFAAWCRIPGNHQLYIEMAETSRLLDRLGTATARQTRAVPTPMRIQRKSTYWLPIGLAAAACAVFLFVRAVKSPVSQPSFAETLVTEIGGARSEQLPDGSTLRLNTDSEVQVTYLARERRLRLIRGEAYFTVAKNPARPFWVEAGPISVRAVGTAFNVRLQADAVDVVVTEGKVRVVNGDGREAARREKPEDLGPLLTMDHIGRVSLAKTADASGSMVITAAGPKTLQSLLAWQQGRLEFSGRPLEEVVAEFNRYNHHKIIIADPALAKRLFGGAFASHDAAPLLELLEQSFGVVAEEQPGATVLHLTH